MKRVAAGIATLSVIIIASTVPVLAQSSVLETSQQAAQRALEQRQYKKAETTLKKALDEAATSAAADVGVARARVLLSNVYRESNRFTEAAEQLRQALSIYRSLGYAEPSFAEEYKNLMSNFRNMELDLLGASANALRNNSAVITMARTESGAHIDITMPAPLERQLNSTKVDGIILDTSVSFDMERQPGGVVEVRNIKGFKIHSVEKNTWANLLALKVNGVLPDGKYDAVITAGKGGFTKTVPSQLPPKAYEPVGAIAAQLDQFGNAPAIDLPIATAPSSAPSSAAAAVSQPAPSAVQPTPTATAQPTPVEPILPVQPTATVQTAAPATNTIQPATTVQATPTPAATSPGWESVLQPVTQQQPATQSILDRPYAGPTQSIIEHHAVPTAAPEIRQDAGAPLSAPVKTLKKHSDDDDDDDDDEKDDHLILNLLGKAIKTIHGKK